MDCERVKSQNFSNTLDVLEALDLERTKGVRAFFEQSPLDRPRFVGQNKQLKLTHKSGLMKGAEVNFMLRRIILFFFVAIILRRWKYLLVVEGSGADEILSFARFRVAPQLWQIHLQPVFCADFV